MHSIFQKAVSKLNIGGKGKEKAAEAAAAADERSADQIASDIASMKATINALGECRTEVHKVYRNFGDVFGNKNDGAVNENNVLKIMNMNEESPEKQHGFGIIKSRCIKAFDNVRHLLPQQAQQGAIPPQFGADVLPAHVFQRVRDVIASINDKRKRLKKEIPRLEDIHRIKDKQEKKEAEAKLLGQGSGEGSGQGTGQETDRPDPSKQKKGWRR